MKADAMRSISEYGHGMMGGLAAIALVAALALIGCTGSDYDKADDIVQDKEPMMVLVEDHGEWKVLADKETGVEYIQHHYSAGRSSRESLSVRLDADGKPIICERVIEK